MLLVRHVGDVVRLQLLGRTVCVVAQKTKFKNKKFEHIKYVVSGAIELIIRLYSMGLNSLFGIQGVKIDRENGFRCKF